MRHASIGARLMAWYAGLLAAALAIFGFLAVWQLRRAVFQSADAQLAQVISGVQTILRENVPQGESELREELTEYAAELKPAVALDVRMDGAPLAISGPVAGASRVAFGRVTMAGKRFEFRAAVSVAPGLAMVRAFSGALLALAPLLLIFASAAGWWISRRALRPVDRITREARSIGVENLSRRLAVPGAGDELTRLSEAWNEMLARLEESVRGLSRFTADASHEMRSPVAVIRTTAELALRRERSSDDYRAALAEVSRQAARLSSLIEDLLALARAEEGADSSFTMVDLAAAVRAACALLDPLARGRSVRIAVDLPSAESLIRGHEPSIRRLAMVLLDNAVKFSLEGGSVTLRIQLNGTEVVLAVEDHGPGIPAEDLPHIFERFYRADPVRTPGVAGAGLGLSLAQSIAQSHGTEIHVETEVGRGSIFRVAFPVAIEPAAAIEAGKSLLRS